MPKVSNSNTGVILAHNPDQTGGRLTNLPIPAGATVSVNSRGTQAYLVVATANVNMRPRGGDFVQYGVGTGINTTVPFDTVEVYNFNAFAVVVSVWCGFDGYIDNRLIIANSSNPMVAFPTYSVPNSATFVNILDLTGGVITDINGVKWLALYRSAIQIFNLDAGNTYKLGAFSPTGADLGKYVAAIPPSPLPISLPISGNYTYQTGGGNVNAIISEVYSAIPAVA